MATCAPSLFTALIHTEMGAWNAVESALSEAGNALTLGRLLVLRTVRDTPACRIQEVAASQGITLGAASRLVDRLHRDGLLHRTPCEHDRRATILTVTEQGLAHLEEACMIVEKEQERLFAPLSTAQREELTRCLALIAEAAKERA
ncbi:MAG: transcriptional regulator [Actinomyces sp.]|nr:MAG: transcriptional regulator [Actinomyces sp.]